MQVQIKIKKISCIILIVLASGVAGCLTAGVQTSNVLPIVAPTIDQPIHSKQYANDQYKMDCYARTHSMNETMDSVRKAPKLIKVTVGNKELESKPDLDIYLRSKKLAENDYLVSSNCKTGIEKQISSTACWAACSQYLVKERFNAKVAQKDLVSKMKAKKGQAAVEDAADVIDIFNTLGFMGMEYTPNGARHLLDTLAEGRPVMVGLLPKDPGGIGHAVVITAARYSFSRGICLTSGSFGFTEFTVLDPADKSRRTVKASEFDDRIYFVLSYSSPNL